MSDAHYLIDNQASKLNPEQFNSFLALFLRQHSNDKFKEFFDNLDKELTEDMDYEEELRNNQEQVSGFYFSSINRIMKSNKKAKLSEIKDKLLGFLEKQN